MSAKRLLKDESGFSLIELVLVLAIAGFIIVLIANLPTSIALIGQSHRQSLAKEIATQAIEDARTQTYDNLADGTATLSDNRLSLLPSGLEKETISDCPSSICKNDEEVKEVIVEVDWSESGAIKHVSLVTFIAKNGLK